MPGTMRVILVVLALVAGSAGASVEGKAPKQEKATGTVEVILPAGQSMDGEKQARVEFEWFEATDKHPQKGALVLTMLGEDGTAKRVIVARVTGGDQTGVVVDSEAGKAWFVGEVVSDERLRSGCDGHDDGGTHEDGGCTHDDGTTHEDGGCTGDDGGTTHDDGGCTHDDGTTHDDGGCTGDDGGTTHDDGGCTGHDTGSGGRHVSGKESRVGQLIVVKIHDFATPGAAGDGITWKWYSAETAPDIDAIEGWPHLCKKSIVGGNLTVH